MPAGFYAAVENAMDRVLAHSHADPENVSSEQFCKNPNCHEVIYTGTGDYPNLDWCVPCYRYRTEHNIGAPAATIAERNRKREQRKAEA